VASAETAVAEINNGRIYAKLNATDASEANHETASCSRVETGPRRSRQYHIKGARDRGTPMQK